MNSDSNLSDEKYETTDVDSSFPIDKILNIASRPIPSHNYISKDAACELQSLTKEFATIISTEAGANATSSNRKVITGDDVISGLNNIGYIDYATSMKIYLEKYRESKKCQNEN